MDTSSIMIVGMVSKVHINIKTYQIVHVIHVYISYTRIKLFFIKKNTLKLCLRINEHIKTYQKKDKRIFYNLKIEIILSTTWKLETKKNKWNLKFYYLKIKTLYVKRAQVLNKNYKISMLTNNLEMQILKRDVTFHITMSKILKDLNPAATRYKPRYWVCNFI